jgi:hypothetical protein
MLLLPCMARWFRSRQMHGLIVYRWAFFPLTLSYIYHMWAPNLAGPRAITALVLRQSRPCQHPTKRMRSGRMHLGPFNFTPITSHPHTRTVTGTDRDLLHFLPICCRPNLPPHPRRWHSIPRGLMLLLRPYPCGHPVCHGRHSILTVALSSPPPLGSIHTATSAG